MFLIPNEANVLAQGAIDVFTTIFFWTLIKMYSKKRSRPSETASFYFLIILLIQ